jgi:ribose-phosphate pyrophosphokinase
VLIGGTVSEPDTLELYDLACGLTHWGARRIDLVIPYFGYSTMERAERPGEVVTAKTRARLLSSIPSAPGGNRVFVVDLHVDAITYYFERGLTAVHVYARPLIAAVAGKLGGADYVIACTDAGRAKWVEWLANDLGVPAAFVYKRRKSGDETEVAGVSAQVKGRKVIIYDDMIRTGGSLLGAARAFHGAGAASVDAVATHGVFAGDSLASLQSSGLIGHLVCTDTHPRAPVVAGDFLKVESVVPLLSARLQSFRGS